MLAHQYAHAAYMHIQNGTQIERVFERLNALLEQRGHTQLKRQVYQALLRIAHKASQTHAPQLTMARKKDENKISREIEALLQELNSTEKPLVVEDPTLIGGYTLRVRDRYVDRSYKKALLNIYRRALDATT